MEEDIYTWSANVSSYVKFKKDRNRVYQEILTHLLDKTEALEALGMDRKKASMQAIQEMGDPNKLGKRFAKLHKPHFGWLFLVSRMVVIILFVLVLILNKYGENVKDKFLSYMQSSSSEFIEELYQNKDNLTEFQQLDVSGNETATIEDYDFSIKRAISYKKDIYHKWLYFTVRATYPFFLPSSEGVEYHMTAIDSNGNEYGDISVYTYEPAVVGNKERVGFTSCDFEMWIENLDLTAKWVDITYERFHRKFSFRISLSEVTK